MHKTSCYHCGNDCKRDTVFFDKLPFCCNGCKTVYEILSTNDLASYYALEQSPGSIPKKTNGKFNYLENEQLVDKLYDFIDQEVRIITLHIPSIHCSSCIWVLENIAQLNTAVIAAQVNFPKKEVRLVYNPTKATLKQLVELLSAIGYEPSIHLENNSGKKQKIDRSLLYKLGVAGFAFGNIMLLSFPEYFQSNGVWLEKYRPLFRIIIFITVLPTVFYAASDYFVSAYKGLKYGVLNIDVPIVLGILVLFIRSAFEVFFDIGPGYFDSLAGFIFFLLLGKIFQQQTYHFLSFERDYKSYFPIAVTKITAEKGEVTLSIYDVKKGDVLLIKNNELIPVDGILLSNNTQLDYSFVSGESSPVSKNAGDKIFAGGKQLLSSIEMEVSHSISQSYLTQLWSNPIFSKKTNRNIKTLTDSISKQFTLVIVGIAFLGGIYWYINDISMVANVVTAVLIVACPCALALSAPFALGNMLRILGRQKIYLKNAATIENLSKIDTVIFDKTGTITTSKTTIKYEGLNLNKSEKSALKSLFRESSHPLSRILYEHLYNADILQIKEYKEITGQGISGVVNGLSIKLGSASFVGLTNTETHETKVHVKINHTIKGAFIFNQQYRSSILSVFNVLVKNYTVGILSGDNNGQYEFLSQLLPKRTLYCFNQTPQEKLTYIKQLQESGRKVLMIGDGLNDAGALAQSDVGLVISENSSLFSPASDGIIDASKFHSIGELLKLSKQTISVVKYSFILSFLYNFIGILFAITGNLTPIVAAILMPLSSISIVIFVTVSTTVLAKKYKKSKADNYHSSPSLSELDLSHN